MDLERDASEGTNERTPRNVYLAERLRRRERRCERRRRLRESWSMMSSHSHHKGEQQPSPRGGYTSHDTHHAPHHPNTGRRGASSYDTHTHHARDVVRRSTSLPTTGSKQPGGRWHPRHTTSHHVTPTTGSKQPGGQQPLPPREMVVSHRARARDTITHGTT